MNPTPQLSRAEAVLTAVMNRFQPYVAPVGTPNVETPLAGIHIGPYLGQAKGYKYPWLTIELNDIARRRVTTDGQVENQSSLDLTIDDAVQTEQAGLLLAYRWAAWVESVLLLPNERPAGPFLGGIVDWIEPDGIALSVGGLGYASFSVRARFQLRYSTDFGTPFTA